MLNGKHSHGQKIVVGFNDSSGFYNNRQGLSGFAYSTNGGKSFHRRRRASSAGRHRPLFRRPRPGGAPKSPSSIVASTAPTYSRRSCGLSIAAQCELPRSTWPPGLPGRLDRASLPSSSSLALCASTVKGSSPPSNSVSRTGAWRASTTRSLLSSPARLAFIRRCFDRYGLPMLFRHYRQLARIIDLTHKGFRRTIFESCSRKSSGLQINVPTSPPRCEDFRDFLLVQMYQQHYQVAWLCLAQRASQRLRLARGNRH